MTSQQNIARQPQPARPENLARFYGAIGISAVAAALQAVKGDHKCQAEKPLPLHVQNFLHELAA